MPKIFCGLLGFVVLATCPQLAKASDVLEEGSHVLIYSDAGFANEGQYAVANAMAQRHAADPFDFAVSAGDNLQDGLITSHSLAQVFEEPFKPLIQSGLQFFAVLGNHDHLYDRAAAWLQYSRDTDAIGKNRGGFVMPDYNHVLRRPGQKWLFLDVASAYGVVQWSEDLQVFVEKHLCTEREQWMFMTFHYPLWSSGMHGETRALRNLLMPIFERCPVDFIFSGHDHQAELFRIGDLRAALVGNTANPRIPAAPQPPESVFRTSDQGFAELYLTQSTARLQFRDLTGAVRFQEEVSK